MWKELVIGLFLVAVLGQFATTEASCYFPQDVQGEFVLQNAVTAGMGIQYSTLNITENSIPIWGNCHRRIGNNFILMFNYSETLCVRCLHLKLRSANVLQIFAADQETISKCYTNEESAEANCPTEESVAARETAEILLFKTRDHTGSYVNKQYCPIDGNYHLNYKSLKTSKHFDSGYNECSGFTSMLNSCPSGSTLNFKLKNCSFEGHDMKFECLGHWKGTDDEVFMIFTDSRHVNNLRPKYRCAVYKQDKESGKIHMALSRDSTCTTDLYNITSGFETFVLSPRAEEPWPAEVSLGVCSFPKWMDGSWEHVRVRDNTMVYRDQSSFKTLTIKCVGVLEDSDKYLVFSRTQCNEESYTCLRLANRSNNILEFQIGRNASENNDVTLCADENFQDDSWITQGRLDITLGVSTGMCPITGEYTGRIPDDNYLCAKLWSDCRAPELMYYQVSQCETEEIYEEREYQCLGHWRESNLLYTYTERKDVAAGTHECFVGLIFSDQEIYIKEAGAHCQRHVDPLRYGMKLIKKQPLYSCIERSTTVKHVPRVTTERPRPRFTTYTPRRTTASQDFDTNEIPQSTREDKNAASYLTPPFYCIYLILCSFTIISYV